MKKIILSVSIMFLLICFTPAHAAIFSVFFDVDGDALEDTSYSLAPGGSFSVDIYASDTLPSVITMGFDLTYVPTQVDVNSLNVAVPPWGFEPSATDDGNGLLQFAGGVPFGSPTASGKTLLGTVDFSCIDFGISDLTLAAASAAGGGFYDASFQPITDISFGSLTVSQVPIPPTVLLLGAGLVGLVGIRRRVRR